MTLLNRNYLTAGNNSHRFTFLDIASLLIIVLCWIAHHGKNHTKAQKNR